MQALQNISLETVKGDCTPNSGLVAILDRYISSSSASEDATELETISELFQHMLELLRSKRRSINKETVIYDLTTFTRGILFGEAFHVEDGDGRKTTVKRAKQVRRDAQVLLDCRWFAKKFTKQRLDMLREQRALSGDHEEEIEVICTLASHLKLQVRRSLP